MLSYGRQSIDQSDINSVTEILKGDWLTQGPITEKFENNLKSYFGTKYCCAVSNGTAALHLSGIALEWKEEDIIITSPITFLASANCILYSRATPDFVDIDPISYTINPNQLEEKLKLYQNKGKKVKAVIGVDYAGHPCDWKALRQLANKYELQLINDNCHALGAEYYNDIKYAGKYADVITQSYHPVKHITTGEGGSILTNDPIIDEKVRRLRSHGMTKNIDFLDKNEGPWYYEMHEVGYNYRITDFQCALGINQLNKLNQFLARRRAIAKKYNNLFNNNLLITPVESSNVSHAYHIYPLQINFNKTSKGKNIFFEKMKNKNISLQVHYIPVHLQPFYKKNYGFDVGDFPNAENFYNNEISIPIYPLLKDREVNIVADAIFDSL